MKAFYATFVMGLKFSLKSWLMWMVMLLFPIVIIFILGTTLESAFNPVHDFEPQPLAVVAQRDGPMGRFVQSEEIERFFAVTFTDAQTAYAMVEAGEAIAAFVEEGIQPSIIVPAASSAITSVALSVFQSYQQMGAAAALAYLEGRDIAPLMETQVYITDRPLGTRIPGSLDYYAVTMIIMMLMFSGVNGAELYFKGLISETGNRIRTGPARQTAVIGGLLTSATVSGFIQIIPTFAFTALVYNVYWGERLPLVLLTLFVMVVFSQAMGIMLVMLFRSEGAASGVMNLVIFGSTFVSGGYMRIDFGETLSRIFQYAPNALAHTVIFGAIYGGNETTMMTSLAILGAICVVLFAFALFFGRRRPA